MTQIKLDEEIIENSIEVEELAGDKESDFYSLMILNDIDSIINKKIFKMITALRNQLLQKAAIIKLALFIQTLNL